jgi:hypothetical protein
MQCKNNTSYFNTVTYRIKSFYNVLNFFLKKMIVSMVAFTGEMTYVNLQLNPERYTGYTGPSARRIWDAVYSENCPKCKLSSETTILYIVCHMWSEY